LRDNPNGGTYSLLYAAYLKMIQNNGVPLTQDDHIFARRLSRGFPIMCVVSFLKSCSSVDSYVELRDRFIESVGENKLGTLKPMLIDESYVGLYQYCSKILAANNDGQEIKSLVEDIGSVHKVNLESIEDLDNKESIERVIRYLKEELLFKSV
jgi:hypothetical protein